MPLSQSVPIHSAALERRRRQEQARQVQAQAAAHATMMQSVGSGALGVVALALNRYVDPGTGQLLQSVPLRDLPGLMKAGAELIQLSTGQPTVVLGQGDSVALERILPSGMQPARRARTTGVFGMPRAFVCLWRGADHAGTVASPYSNYAMTAP
jgi:hypothetical protein